MASNMKKRLHEFGQEETPQKRLLEEKSRLQAALNQSFLDYCSKADKLASWKDAARDYELYTGDIVQRTFTGVSSSEGAALFSFGCGDCGQLGHGVSDPPIEEEETSVEFPKKVKFFENAKEIRILEAGGLSNALVDARGVWTWGCADDGALGREGDENTPTLLTFPSKVIVSCISLGECHGAAVGLSGQTFLWGSFRDKDGKTFFPTTATLNGNGKQSGAGTVSRQPSEMRALTNIVSCASGANHTIFRSSDGEVFSLGFGDQGQLGRTVSKKFKIPDPNDKDEEIYDLTMIHREHLSPAKITLDFPARSVACGAYHTFIISAYRCEVYGCGLNQYQQVMASSEVNINLSKIAALDGKSIQSIRGGEHFSLAVGMDGAVYTWGRSDQAQLGRPAKGSGDAGAFDGTPAKVPGLPPVTSVYGGSCHVIARTKNGHVFSWGFGEMLQLGHGERTLGPDGRLDQPAPKRIEKFEGMNALVVSAGAQHSCVLVGPKD